MQERKRRNGPDFQKFADFEIVKPHGWLSLFSRIRGLELAISLIGLIGLGSVYYTKQPLPVEALIVVVGGLVVLGCASVFRDRSRNASSSKDAAACPTES